MDGSTLGTLLLLGFFVVMHFFMHRGHGGHGGGGHGGHGHGGHGGGCCGGGEHGGPDGPKEEEESRAGHSAH